MTLLRRTRRRVRVIAELIGAQVPRRRRGREATRSFAICGFPRSGTSLLFNMMAATLEGFRYEKREAPFSDYLWQPGNWLSKLPNDVLKLSVAHRRNYYGKRIDAVVVIRDIRDIITSIHPNLPDRYYIGYEKRDADWTNLPAGVGRIYAEIVALKRNPPPGCTISFATYEEIVTDPDRIQEEIGSAHALRFRAPFTSFLEFKDRLVYSFDGTRGDRLEDKKIDTSRLGKWRTNPRHVDRVRSEFNKFPQLFTILRELGYESDDTWFDSLR